MTSVSSVELVVAHYDEDLGWLRRVPAGVRVTVYHKGTDDTPGIRIPNEGHEETAYLTHLARRYESLAPVTVFAQGRPFDHVPDFHRILRNLAARPDAAPPFQWLGFIVDQDDPDGHRVFRKWAAINPEGRPLPMRKVWPAVWPDEPMPDAFVFFPGGHFVVRDTCAQRRARSFYERALEVARRIPDAGHCFERAWDRVFGTNGFPPDLRDRPLPLYLRPVRRLGLTWKDVPERYRPWRQPLTRSP